MRISDWSSDVCSSDLRHRALARRPAWPRQRQQGHPGNVARRRGRRRVNQDAPRHVPAPSTRMDAEDTLAELLGYLADPDLPPEYREALQQACDALQVDGAVAAAERPRYPALFDAGPEPVRGLARAGPRLPPK